MKIILLVFTLLYAFNVSGEPKILKENLTVDGKKRNYYLYVPEGVSQVQPAPLLVLLHGSNRNGNSLVEKWKALADKEKFIIVGPDFLHQLVESLKTKYPINQRKVYLFGHSSGAKFGVIIGLMQSQYFAAAAIHGGTLMRDSFPTIKYAKRKIPVGIFIGDKDQFCPLGFVQESKVALTEAQIPVEITLLKGHDHGYYDLAPKINELAWAILKKNSLDEDQHYETYTFQK
jgi:poly(3-hydroxybutyrate) depolymerase